jgi:hypothetical protein
LKNRKIVFLDIDGVLNSDAFADYMLMEDNVDIFNEDMLDERAILQLKKIVESAKAEIVLSSSWRWYKETRDKVHYQLRQKGIDFVDTTPLEINTTLSRGVEIKTWLDEHPEVEGFVILDDDDLRIEELLPYHVKTTFKYGLTREKAAEAIKILNGETNE